MGYWSEQGFVAYELSYYKEKLQDLFKEAFGNDFLVDDSLPQGVLIQRLAELLYNTDMDGIDAFAKLNLNTASGIYLDMLGAQRGFPRSQGSAQIIQVQLTMNSSNFMPFTIPAGQAFELTDGGGTFICISGASITSATQIIELEYSQIGNSGASVGAKMTTEGFAQILDIEIIGSVDGQPQESDFDYRTRLRNSYPVAGQTIQYVQNLIAALPEVRLTGTNYNDTDEVVDNLPPYTTEWLAVPYASAGSTETALAAFKDKVAKVIVDNKMPGAPTAGNTTVSVIDLFDKEKTVKFTIPAAVRLEISVTLTTPEETGRIDLSGVPFICNAIGDYINKLDIGTDVSYSRCMAPLTADKNFDIGIFKIREYVDAPDYVMGGAYQIGEKVRLNGIVYRALVETDTYPDGSPDWEVYNEGWIINGNYPITSREYATIDVKNIYIGI